MENKKLYWNTTPGKDFWEPQTRFGFSYSIQTVNSSDSQSVGCDPLVGRKGTADGPLEVIYNKSFFVCEITKLPYNIYYMNIYILKVIIIVIIRVVFKGLGGLRSVRMK